MASKSLFRGAARSAPPTTSLNHAHAPAYGLDSRAALAQLAATGCFGQTYYVSGREQLDELLGHAAACDPAYVAEVAVNARQRGHMKDMPALLLAHLTTRGPAGLAAMEAAFPDVVDNGRMLRTFVQVLRSGQLGRKSLGTAPKKAVQRWLASRSPMQLFRDSVGNDPSLADVIRMVHPRPASGAQRAMIGYLLGKAHDADELPRAVRAFDAFQRGELTGVDALAQMRGVPSRMLTGRPLGTAEWTFLATQARWQETRMNLNAYQRHGVFEDPAMVELVAQRLASEAEVRSAKVFPYQLLVAWKATAGVPLRIQEALQDAMEHAVANVPAIDGQVVICPDVSGSMAGPITGHRKGATSAVRCVDVAGLITAAILRKNRSARVLPFAHDVRPFRPNPRDSVMTLADSLAALCGGGTSCSAPLRTLNRAQARVNAVIFVSDNESWMDAEGRSGWGGTALMEEWMTLKRRNPAAKLVCIDLTPNVHAQTVQRADILNVGGFSDAVFDVVAGWVASSSRGLLKKTPARRE